MSSLNVLTELILENNISDKVTAYLAVVKMVRVFILIFPANLLKYRSNLNNDSLNIVLLLYTQLQKKRTTYMHLL